MTLHRSFFILVAAATCGSTTPREATADEPSVPAFRRHVINADSQYSACAAIDVNQDGRLDIVAGGYWYAAPTWQRHVTREVEQIRGRFDDYSNLPLDVDGDGRVDLVSANYRSESLYWVQQPKDATGRWQHHLIDRPGRSETGRLFDVDGDGDLDLLPNGTNFAAWYELSRPELSQSGDDPAPTTWIRHDLPPALAGHGIGFGDIDGDGRGDIVGRNGWFRAAGSPTDIRWQPRPEFQLHRDAGIPILVLDLDGDGDNDVVWSRGHDFGLYWLEQLADDPNDQLWQMHAIDTSWSCAHALLVGDVNGDGRLDLIAGKRFMGHDGKDPGEYDPLGVWWYDFQLTDRTWQRHTISTGGGCGFDLDPKCIDMDGDGDLDILASARSGLFYLENVGTDATVSAPVEPKPEDYDHADLTYYFRDGERRPIETRFEWSLRRQHILGGMQRAMGPFPETARRVPLSVRVESTTDMGEYDRQKIWYTAEAGGEVPAFLLVPHQLAKPAPAMLCLHPTHTLGKSQICGLGGNPTRFYAHELARRGYVCLAPDYPSFGDYDYDFAAASHRHASGTMKAIWDNVRGIDLLESLAEVDRDHIGCIGHSLGGHNGLYTAAFDRRLRVVVTSCGFNAFEDYYGGDLTGWSSDRYMPRIRSEFATRPANMPFDFHEVLAAVAPRPVFINAPLHDANFAVSGVRKTVDAARPIYDLLGASSELHVVYPEAEHDFPDPIRQQVYEWLDKYLKP